MEDKSKYHHSDPKFPATPGPFSFYHQPASTPDKFNTQDWFVEQSKKRNADDKG